MLLVGAGAKRLHWFWCSARRAGNNPRNCRLGSGQIVVGFRLILRVGGKATADRREHSGDDEIDHQRVQGGIGGDGEATQMQRID